MLDLWVVHCPSLRKLGELLQEAGVLDDASLQKALSRQRTSGRKLGETLIELGLVSEDVLFDVLARQLEIPIIAEPKLMLVEVPKPVLGLLTAAEAWGFLALPLLVDQTRRQLSVVTSEPNDTRLAAGIRKVTGIPGVKPYLAKGSAIRKVLMKYYGAAPASSGSAAKPAPPPPPPGVRPRIDPAAMATNPGLPDPGPGGPELEIPDELILSEDPEESEPTAGSNGAAVGRIALTAPPPRLSALGDSDSTSAQRALAAAKQKIIRRVIVADPNKVVAGSAKRTLEAEGYTVEAAHSSEEILNLCKAKQWDLVVVKGAIAENVAELERRVRTLFPMIEFRIVPSFAVSLMGDPVPYTRLSDFTFEGFDLLMGLIDRGNVATRSRAQTNARYAKLVAQRLMLPRKSVDEVYLSAFLDALGDLVVRSRGGDAGDRGMARNLALELFRQINPPYDVEAVLTRVEERYDGGGPGRLKGEQIPIGARILSVVLGYTDAKGMPKDKLQKFLREMSGKTFDPRIVETFLQILRNEELLGDVGSVVENAGSVYIVDKDVGHTSTLELRLANEGYKAVVFTDGQAALDMIRESPPLLVLSEIAIPRMDGFNLCMSVKQELPTADVPFVFVSGKTDEFNQNKAMDLGADDFIPKPVNVEFLLKKLAKFLVKPKPAAPTGGSGVRGRLADLGLIELIQTLSLGMKTAKLELLGQAGKAALWLEEGRIVAAETPSRTGEEAFYQVATWTDGDFVILAGEKAAEKNVGASNDFLILEALRRLDEGLAGMNPTAPEPAPAPAPVKPPAPMKR